MRVSGRANSPRTGRVRRERSFVRVRFIQNLPWCGTCQGIPAVERRAGNHENEPNGMRMLLFVRPWGVGV
ncbi:hypothetical protein GCM10009731_32830 [Streptomyces globosus]